MPARRQPQFSILPILSARQCVIAHAVHCSSHQSSPLGLLLHPLISRRQNSEYQAVRSSAPTHAIDRNQRRRQLRIQRFPSLLRRRRSAVGIARTVRPWRGRERSAQPLRETCVRQSDGCHAPSRRRCGDHEGQGVARSPPRHDDAELRQAPAHDQRERLARYASLMAALFKLSELLASPASIRLSPSVGSPL